MRERQEAEWKLATAVERSVMRRDDGAGICQCTFTPGQVFVRAARFKESSHVAHESWLLWRLWRGRDNLEYALRAGRPRASLTHSCALHYSTASQKPTMTHLEDT